MIVYLESAQRIFKQLSGVFHGAGYLLAIYGSVVADGCGKDIDFIAVPWRPSPTPPDLLVTSMGFEFEPYYGIMNTCAVLLHINGFVVDVQFREFRGAPSTVFGGRVEPEQRFSEFEL